MVACCCLTGLAVPDDSVQRSDELSKDTIDMVEAGQYNHDIGARVGVSLAQEAGQEDTQGLDMVSRSRQSSMA